jgi:acyl-[acyl carrier protein]--UDP-N-acetylglucosamine O-acyltransferase
VGAAVFVMGKARVAIHDCLIDSAGGFGVWVKHGGRVEVSDTTFLSAGEGRGVRGVRGGLFRVYSIVQYSAV